MYIWILSQIVADTQKKLASSISLKIWIWIWDVHRLVAHVTIAYLHLLYLLCLGRPLSLSLSASFSVSCGPASNCLVGHAPKLLAPCQDRPRHRGSTENFPPLCLTSCPAQSVYSVTPQSPAQSFSVRSKQQKSSSVHSSVRPTSMSNACHIPPFHIFVGQVNSECKRQRRQKTTKKPQRHGKRLKLLAGKAHRERKDLTI